MRLELGKQEIEVGSLMTINALGFLTNHFNDPIKSKEMEVFETLTQDKKTLIDIGCSYGAFSITFTKDPNKVAHAVDASFRVQLALKQTCLLNPKRNIHQYRALIGKETGVAKCVFDEHQSLMMNNQDSQAYSVEPVMTLDDFCEFYSITPDVINIDVEGCEIDVLEGAQKTLVKCRPLVFVEIHKNFVKKFYGKSPIDVYNQFVNLENYKAFDANLKELPLTRYCIYIDNIAEESVVNIWIPQ